MFCENTQKVIHDYNEYGKDELFVFVPIYKSISETWLVHNQEFA